MILLQLAFWPRLVNWLESHQSPCLIRSFTGHDCPGCGLQGAMIALLRGNLWESIQRHPGLIPMLLLVVFLLFHLKFRFKNGHHILIGMIIFVLIVFLINFLLKLATHN